MKVPFSRFFNNKDIGRVVNYIIMWFWLFILVLNTLGLDNTGSIKYIVFSALYSGLFMAYLACMIEAKRDKE